MLLPGKKVTGPYLHRADRHRRGSIGGGRTVSRFREERLDSGGQMPMIFTKEEPA